MRTELWGLRNKETHELVLYYWASSQKHKALFSSQEKAEAACKWNEEYEPYRIVDPENYVEYGEWIESPTGNEVICSYCHADWNVFDNDTYRFRYCPNCGITMKGDNDE